MTSDEKRGMDTVPENEQETVPSSIEKILEFQGEFSFAELNKILTEIYEDDRSYDELAASGELNIDDDFAVTVHPSYDDATNDAEHKDNPFFSDLDAENNCIPSDISDEPSSLTEMVNKSKDNESAVAFTDSDNTTQAGMTHQSETEQDSTIQSMPVHSSSVLVEDPAVPIPDSAVPVQDPAVPIQDSVVPVSDIVSNTVLSGPNPALYDDKSEISESDMDYLTEADINGQGEIYPDETNNPYSYENSYTDNTAFRSNDNSREYRSFDPDYFNQPENGWYSYEEEDDEADDEESDIPEERHHGLKIFANALLVFLAVLGGIYLFCLYSGNSFVSYWREMYIQTAMNSIHHKWLATALIPGDIIDEVMIKQYSFQESQQGLESNWADIVIPDSPIMEQEVISAAEEEAENSVNETEPTEVASETEIETSDESIYGSEEEETFFTWFYELDFDSTKEYLKEHPAALDDGWMNININHSALTDVGTSIETVYGDQVLAINAEEKILLVRITIGSSRGVLAICKDINRLSLCPASTLGVIGQVAGAICEDNDGIFGVTGSAFQDDGTSNGGQMAGVAVCSGQIIGERLALNYKRMELRNDNRMYIVDSSAPIDPDTRDACEFLPALIVDGQIVVDENCGWTAPNPRTIIGQSKYTEAMFVVVEGRLADSPGCSVVPLAEMLVQYGCVQALNLDGGTSAIMYYDGEYITRCSNQALPGGRTLPTAWVYKKCS